MATKKESGQVFTPPYLVCDILNQDALSVSCFDGKMDFVVGNPPYVRVHNLADRYHNVKHLRFKLRYS